MGLAESKTTEGRYVSGEASVLAWGPSSCPAPTPDSFSFESLLCLPVASSKAFCGDLYNSPANTSPLKRTEEDCPLRNGSMPHLPLQSGLGRQVLVGIESPA